LPTLRPPGTAPGKPPIPDILKERAEAEVRGTGRHFDALKRLADGSTAKRLAERYKDWSVGNRQRRDLDQQEKFFLESRDILMAPERWTYGNFLAYQRKMIDLLGGNSWTRRLQGESKDLEFLEKQLKVLEAMTPVELASNHKSVFTKQSIRLIAEKSGCDSVEFVTRVLFTHDSLRADRKWFMIRQQFGKPLPRTLEERAMWAEYDRPPSETELEYQTEFIEKEMKKVHRKSYKQKKILWLWPRKRSIGGNRWSVRPPKWYPTRWTNPQKSKRLVAPS